MQRLTAAILLSVTALGLITGCSVSARQGHGYFIENKNLIFNPHFIHSCEIHVPRTGWPTTVAFEHPREHVEYRETIIDRQTTHGHIHDFLYRRFDSVRVGRAYR